MTNKLDLSILASRPSWRIPKFFKWAAIIAIVISIAVMLVSVWCSHWYLTLPEGDTQEMFANAMAENTSDISYFSAWLGFVALMSWLMAIIADRLDQLVWLNASEEDRLHIYNQRQKKKKQK